MEALNKELDDQRTKKLHEMRIKKQEFTPGMWNVHSVLLGGLGRDPDVEGQLALCEEKILVISFSILFV